MSRYLLEIHVTPRPGLLDPEGQAIQHALENLGFGGVRSVRVGKALYLRVEAESPEAAREEGTTMCRKLLANPVTENFEVAILEEDPAPGGGPEGRTEEGET